MYKTWPESKWLLFLIPHIKYTSMIVIRKRGSEKSHLAVNCLSFDLRTAGFHYQPKSNFSFVP